MTEAAKLLIVCPYCGDFQRMDYFHIPALNVVQKIHCGECHKIILEMKGSEFTK